MAVAPVIRDSGSSPEVGAVCEISMLSYKMPSYPSQLIHSAAHFMVTLTGTVRPPSIWKLKEFTELYSGVHNLRLCPEDRRLLVRALTNVLLLHWPGLNEQVEN